MHSERTLLHLLHLASPALPIGAYAYSQGLESAVELGWVRDEASAQDWIITVLDQVIARNDLALLSRLHTAWCAHDAAQVEHWNAMLLALREARELQLEDTQMGGALARLLSNLNIETATPWMSRDDATYATLFALACAHWNIAAHDTLHAFAWAWCENQIAAAIKLVPLGQTSGQRIVAAVIEAIPRAVERALSLSDDDVGFFAPRLALGSAWHEEQYSRLFRS